jgi:uncharacterized protein YjgD (DUF1641 family)
MSGSNGTLQLQVSEIEKLQKRLNDPQVAAALNRILDNIDLLALSVTSLDGFLRRGDVIADSLGKAVNELKDTSPTVNLNPSEIITSVLKFKKTADEIVAVLESDEFSTLKKSGIFDPRTVSIIGEAGNALQETYDSERTAQPKKLGIFGLLKTLRDPEVQWSLNFLIEFSKRFSRKINA